MKPIVEDAPRTSSTVARSCTPSMRQHRQVSQETQQRRLILQRLADRKQGQAVFLESSSSSGESDHSDSDASPEAQSRLPQVDTGIAASQRGFKRLSQAKAAVDQQENARTENLPNDHTGLSPRHNPSDKQQRPSTSRMADPEDLLSSFSSLSVSKPKRPSHVASSSFAAALTTQLPDEPPANSKTPAPYLAKAAASTAEPDTLQKPQPEFKMQPDIESKLYKHQLEGVQWLWTLHKMRRGGILGAYRMLFGCLTLKQDQHISLLILQEMTWGLERSAFWLSAARVYIVSAMLVYSCCAASSLFDSMSQHAEMMLQTMQCSAFLAGMFHSGLMR